MTDSTPAPPPESVRVSSTSHRVAVIAEDRSDVHVDGEAIFFDVDSPVDLERARGLC